MGRARERGAAQGAQRLPAEPDSICSLGGYLFAWTHPVGLSFAAAAAVLCVLQEYRSAAYALRGASSPKAVFLRCYATYLAGEKRKE